MSKKKVVKKTAVKKVSKKKVAKKAIKPVDTDVVLELDGHVWLIETNRKTGKVISKEEINGETVLGVLLSALEDAIMDFGKKVK